MREIGFRVLVLAVGAAALVGCGGNVVVDQPGSAGGGGGGTGVTTLPTDPPSYCAGVCAVAQQQGCLMGSSQSECTEGCVFVFDQYPDCKAELTDLYDCLTDQFADDCGSNPSACASEALGLASCVQDFDPPSACEEYQCDEGSNACSCYGICGDEKVASECKQTDEGYYDCACYVDGELVGSCDLSASCSVLDGCCADYFSGGF